MIVGGKERELLPGLKERERGGFLLQKERERNQIAEVNRITVSSQLYIRTHGGCWMAEAK